MEKCKEAYVLLFRVLGQSDVQQIRFELSTLAVQSMLKAEGFVEFDRVATQLVRCRLQIRITSKNENVHTFKFGNFSHARKYFIDSDSFGGSMKATLIRVITNLASTERNWLDKELSFSPCGDSSGSLKLCTRTVLGLVLITNDGVSELECRPQEKTQWDLACRASDARAKIQNNVH